MTTPTARDLPGQTPTAVRLIVCAVLVAGAGGTGAFWAHERGGMIAVDASAPVALMLPVAAAIAATAAWLAVHRRRGREPAVNGVGTVAQPPSRHSPALVGWLLRYGTTTPDDLAATIISLLERGHVAVDTSARSIAATATLDADSGEDRIVLDWLAQGPVGVGDRAAAITAEPRSWQTFWARYTDVVTGRGRTEGLVERTAASEEILSVGLLSSSVIVGGAIGMARGYPAWLACVIAGAVILVFADTLARRSPQGAQLAAQWRAYCGHLGSHAEAAGDQAPYAVAVGVGAPLTREQRLVVEAVEQWHGAYVTASAFLSGPSARLRARR